VLIASAYLAMYFGGLHGDAWRVPVIILGKVYSNAMMVNFNHRIQISGSRNDIQTSAFTTPFFLDNIAANDIEIRGER
jgi:hypothetical protein